MTGPATVHLVPLDATASLPITRTFIDRLAADQHAPGARVTYRIATQPDMLALIDLGIMYWWDAAAAVSLVHDDGTIATFESVRVDVVQDGVQSGRPLPYRRAGRYERPSTPTGRHSSSVSSTRSTGVADSKQQGLDSRRVNR